MLRLSSGSGIAGAGTGSRDGGRFQGQGQLTVGSGRPNGGGTRMPEGDRNRLEFQKSVPSSGCKFDIGIITSNAGHETPRGPIPLFLIPAPVNCRCGLTLPRPTGAASVLRGRDCRGRDSFQGQRQISGSGSADSGQRQARRRRYTDAGKRSLPVGPRGDHFGWVLDGSMVIRGRGRKGGRSEGNHAAAAPKLESSPQTRGEALYAGRF